MDIRWVFAILALVHVPVALGLVAQLFYRSWTRPSFILHCSFMSYWTINGIWFSIYAFRKPADGLEIVHALSIIQAILCLPFVLYLFPSVREWMGLPSVVGFFDPSTEVDEVKTHYNKKLQLERDKLRLEFQELAHKVHEAVRETKVQKEFLKGKEGLEHLQQWADQQASALYKIEELIATSGDSKNK